MLFVGIDWASEKHDLCFLAEDGRILSEFTITDNLAGFHDLQARLMSFAEVKINIERSDGLLVEWLISQGYPIFITPTVVVAHRRPRRSKDDRGDAYLLAHLLRMGDPECRPLPRQSQVVEHLKHLTSAYDTVLQEQRRLTNRFVYALQRYFPAVLAAFRVPHGLTCLAFVETYATPEAAQVLSQADLVAFLRQNRYSHLYKAEVMYQVFQAPAPRSPFCEGYVASVKLLIPLLRCLYQQRKALEKQIVAVFNQHPEAAWWRSLPGAGGNLTPARLLAWIGDDRSRFPSPEVLQAVAGTVPVTRRSGKQLHVEFRHACSHQLRAAADDLARQSVKHSGWAKAYLNEQLARGHAAPRAYRALANRWLRIIWTLWQTNAPYDENKHVANRSKRGSHPLR